MNKNSTKILFILLFSLLFIFVGFYLSDKNHKEQSTNNKKQIVVSPTLTVNREKAKVNFVFDGDTIEISPKITVRLLGIDAPETANKYTKFREQCYATESAKITKELLMGQAVDLEKDLEETDKYGRLLRYVFLDDVFVNEFLVRNGYAKLEEKTINIKYKDILMAAEKEAKEAKRGLWGKCLN